MKERHRGLIQAIVGTLVMALSSSLLTLQLCSGRIGVLAWNAAVLVVLGFIASVLGVLRTRRSGTS